MTTSPHRRPGHALVRWGFVPALLATCVVSWQHRAEGQAWLTAHKYRLDYASAVLLGLIACIWLGEQLYPARPEWNVSPFSTRAGGFWRDLLYLFFVTQLSALLIEAVSSRVKPHLPVQSLWPVAAPFAAKVLLAFFTVEFGNYWLHRLAHRVPLLWQFHSTHHVVTELTGLKALRTHPVDNLVFSFARYVPLTLLGAGPEELVAATTLGAVLGLLSHANLDLADAGLGLVINYPAFHAVHHSRVLAESNSNFGCHTVLFDRLFGTFKRAPAEPLLLGVDAEGPRSMWRELFWPFYRKVS